MFVVSVISCGAAIYQCVYMTFKSCGNIRVWRSLLATLSIMLTSGGAIAVVAVSFWFVILSLLGIACVFGVHLLAKYDLDPYEKILLERFLARDVHAQNLLLRTVELKQRIVVCEELDHPVTIDGSIYFDVEPIDVRDMAMQGLIGMCDANVETWKTKDGDEVVKFEYYTALDDARHVARLVKERGMLNQYGLMKEEE